MESNDSAEQQAEQTAGDKVETKEEAPAPAETAPPPPSASPSASAAAEGEEAKPKGTAKKEKADKGEGKAKGGKKGEGKGKASKGKEDKGGKGKFDTKGKGKGKAFEPPTGPFGSGSGFRLNVKSLSTDVTNEQLKELFDPFGTVTSAQVKQQDNGKSRGLGFVVLSTEEEGQKAIDAMNGKEVNGMALSVRPAERRALVEGIEKDVKGKGKGTMGRFNAADPMGTQQQAMAAAYMQQYQQHFYLQQLNYFCQLQQAGIMPSPPVRLVAATLKAGEHEGSLKSLSANNGYGFIVCAETYALYQRDVYVDRKLLPAGVKVADRLKFAVEWNAKGHPKATTCSFAI